MKLAKLNTKLAKREMKSFKSREKFNKIPQVKKEKKVIAKAKAKADKYKNQKSNIVHAVHDSKKK